MYAYYVDRSLSLSNTAVIISVFGWHRTVRAVPVKNDKTDRDSVWLGWHRMGWADLVSGPNVLSSALSSPLSLAATCP